MIVFCCFFLGGGVTDSGILGRVGDIDAGRLAGQETAHAVILREAAIPPSVFCFAHRCESVSVCVCVCVANNTTQKNGSKTTRHSSRAGESALPVDLVSFFFFGFGTDPMLPCHSISRSETGTGATGWRHLFFCYRHSRTGILASLNLISVTRSP